MNLAKLSAFIDSGKCEVEDLIRIAVRHNNLRIGDLICLGDRLRAPEKSLRASGCVVIPFSKWVQAMAWYCEGGYEKLFLMARQRISFYRFALAFCEEGKDSAAMQALHKEIGSHPLGNANSRALIWTINTVFLRKNPLSESEKSDFREFLHQHIASSNEGTVYAAACALRAFSSTRSAEIIYERLPMKKYSAEIDLTLNKIRKNHNSQK